MRLRAIEELSKVIKQVFCLQLQLFRVCYPPQCQQVDGNVSCTFRKTEFSAFLSIFPFFFLNVTLSFHRKLHAINSYLKSDKNLQYFVFTTLNKLHLLRSPYWLKYPIELDQLLYQFKKPLWFSAFQSVLDLPFLNTTQKEACDTHQISKSSPQLGASLTSGSALENIQQWGQTSAKARRAVIFCKVCGWAGLQSKRNRHPYPVFKLTKASSTPFWLNLVMY